MGDAHVEPSGESDSHKTRTVMRQTSVYGHRPFLRYAVVVAASFAVAALSWVVSSSPIAVNLADSMSSPFAFFRWTALALLPLVAIAFSSGCAIGLLILPMSDWTYVSWLVSSGWRKIMTHGFLAAGGVFAAISIAYTGYDAQGDNKEAPMSEGAMGIDMMIWNLLSIALALTVWSGYRTAWRIYRQIGAQTMQDRYDAWERDQYIVQSGSWWERFISRPLSNFLGLGGRKPPGGIIYTCVAAPFNAVFSSTVVLMMGGDYNVVASCIIAVSIVYVGLWAAVTKYRDGRVFKKHPSYLLRVRDKDTEETFTTTHRSVYGYG